MPTVSVARELSAYGELKIIAEIPGPCLVTVEGDEIAFTISGSSNITREELVLILNKHGLTVIEGGKQG
jgi:hypothetical protein